MREDSKIEIILSLKLSRMRNFLRIVKYKLCKIKCCIVRWNNKSKCKVWKCTMVSSNLCLTKWIRCKVVLIRWCETKRNWIDNFRNNLDLMISFKINSNNYRLQPSCKIFKSSTTLAKWRMHQLIHSNPHLLHRICTTCKHSATKYHKKAIRFKC